MTRWDNFRREEFACRCCARNLIEDDFIDRLQALRTAVGFPLPITSGYRCPDHNDAVSSTGRAGPHTTGRAADVTVSRSAALKVLRAALELGFTGVGVQQKGASRFLHLDDLPQAPGQPRPTIWSY